MILGWIFSKTVNVLLCVFIFGTAGNLMQRERKEFLTDR